MTPGGSPNCSPLWPTDRRGQSELVAVVLVLVISIASIGALVVVGSSALSDGQRTISISQAENAMLELDSRASLVALGDPETRDLDLGLATSAGRLRTRPDAGWMRVHVVDGNGSGTTVVNRTLGSVAYVNDRTTLAYQGGGVWRSDGEGSAMVSRPEFHYRDGTLTLPILSVDGDRGLNSRVRVSKNGSAVRKFPDPAAGLQNKVRTGEVAITVRSDYYDAWGRYFEERTGGYVWYDHAAETATVVYYSPPTWLSLETGIVATSGAGEVRLGGNSIYIDSYDSSRGTGRYVDTLGANGSVTAVADVVATGSSNVQGDVRSGAAVDLSGTTDVSGTVYWTDDYQQDGASVGGGDERIDGVASIGPIDGYVETTIDRARTANNNTEVSVVSGNDLAGSGTVPAGTYYLENLTLEAGETLQVDTTAGDVTIAVEDTISIVGKGTQASQAARIDVVGDGTVTVFVRGDDPVDLRMGKNGQVDVPDERSGQFRIYGTQDFDAVITSDQSPGQIRFEGIVYAPAGYTGSGSVVVGQTKLFGAIVTGDLTVKQGAEIHYDEGLADERFPRSPTVSRLEYLHVAVHSLNVTS